MCLGAVWFTAFLRLVTDRGSGTGASVPARAPHVGGGRHFPLVPRTNLWERSCPSVSPRWWLSPVSGTRPPPQGLLAWSCSVEIQDGRELRFVF